MKLDRTADMSRSDMKRRKREMEQASMDAASDLLDTDSNATFAMVISNVVEYISIVIILSYSCCSCTQTYVLISFFIYFHGIETIGSSSRRSNSIGEVATV